MAGLSFILDLAVVALVAGVLGMLCRRVGLSAVVGYLAAGIVIGPHTPPFQLVQDAEQVRMLADLGLLFLVFGIGLGFSVRRIKGLGIGPLVATALGALLVLAGVRAGAAVLGLTTQQALCAAAVLMVSSSAIISKVLDEIGANHTRWGQLALGVTLLEDIVAVVMLTLLSSLTVQAGGASPASLWEVLASFAGFAALLFVGVLLAVPRMLRYLKRSATEELVMLLVAGLLLMLGWMAVQLGYSMALAAFVLGAIIGSTPHQPEIDRLFVGMRHLFGAVFFAAMGMMFDVSRIGEFWPAMLLLAGGAFLLRVPATGAAMVLAGSNLRDAARAAHALTPLGEFSFVIAFLAVQSQVMPETFYPAAVGASLLTCVLSPALMKRAEPISDRLIAAIPGPLTRAIAEYHRVLEGIGAARDRSARWRLVAPATTRTTVLLLLVAGVLALATPAYRVAERLFGPDLLVPSGTALLFLLGTGIVVLGPLIAAWRDLAVIASALAESSGGPDRKGSLGCAVVQRAFLLALIGLGGIWLAAVLPTETVPLPALATGLLLLALLLVFLWRNLAALQRRLEDRVHFELSAPGGEDPAQRWSLDPRDSEGEWGLVVQEVVLPANSRHAGASLLQLRIRPDFDCSIVGIDRSGFGISNPAGTERLFPGDRLLVLGPESVLPKAIAYLSESVDSPSWTQQFDELCTEILTVPPGSPCVGKSLRELDLLNRHGVQVGGIRREGAETIRPKADHPIHAGDHLLLLGTPLRIRRFAEVLQVRPA